MNPTHSAKQASIGLAALLLLVPTMIAAAPPEMSTYNTTFYTIHTDLSEEDVREAALRVNRMAEEYARRTSDFSGKITERLPFYIFSNADDYYDAGGMPRSAGVYTGDRLMAISGKAYPSRWRILQHEGFHQFAHRVIGGRLPVWVNEGMAVYFEEAIFTGDNIVTGIVPAWRLRELQSMIRIGGHKPLLDMMSMPHLQWNHEFTSANYMQAWSMVHFLVHGQNGNLLPRFEAFIRDVNIKALTWEKAWQKNFGTDIHAFEKAWKEFWLDLPENAGMDKVAEAAVSTLTSFLGRAASQGQTFTDFSELNARLHRYEGGDDPVWQAHSEDWLPPSLLSFALPYVNANGEWQLIGKGRSARIQHKIPGKLVLQGNFTVQGTRIRSVAVRSLPIRNAPGGFRQPTRRR